MNAESHDIVRTAAQDLVTISRAEQRRTSFGVEEFSGFGLDIWRTSELTWLDRRGNPKRGDLTVTLSCNSMNMVESKSMKLFLMAFAMVQFDSKQAVERTIKEALKDALDADCDVNLDTMSSGFTFDQTYIEESHRLDYIPLGGASFEVDKDLLAPRRSGGRISGKYHTDLFRCLCPISSQPDYATIVVSLNEAWFSAESLLAYLLSYRTHQGFHESTIERIYQDINEVCEPKSLSVLGSFARRGGIDISPFRSSDDELAPNWRSGVS